MRCPLRSSTPCGWEKRCGRGGPRRTKITGVVCGVRVEEISQPLMREIRYLDKLVDELAKGKPMEKILRS